MHERYHAALPIYLECVTEKQTSVANDARYTNILFRVIFIFTFYILKIPSTTLER